VFLALSLTPALRGAEGRIKRRVSFAGKQHSGNIQGILNTQGTFREHSGNIQGRLNIQGKFREHSGNIPRMLESPIRTIDLRKSSTVFLSQVSNIQGTFREHSENIEHSGNIQGTFREY
jgi:glutamine amidotransferase PdxT